MFVRLFWPVASAVLAATVGLLPYAAGAEVPAGIVMAVSGTTDPPLSAMTEIPADTPIRLGTGVGLKFLHYSRCKLVTVAGGTLTLSRTEYKTDGHVESEKDGPCPRVYSLKSGHETAGLILRGAGEPRWPVNSEFLLTGAEAEKVQTAAVYAEDHPDNPVVQLDVAGFRAAKPAGSAPLVPNTRYVLRLTSKNQPRQMGRYPSSQWPHPGRGRPSSSASSEPSVSGRRHHRTVVTTARTAIAGLPTRVVFCSTAKAMRMLRRGGAGR